MKKINLIPVDKPNVNGLVYPKGVVEEYLNSADSNKDHLFAFANLGHSDITKQAALPLANVVGKVENVRIDEEYLVGDLHLLPTPLGVVLQSSNDNYDYKAFGFGNVSEDGTVSNYKLAGVQAILCDSDEI